MNSWAFLASSSSSQAEAVAESTWLRSYFAGLPHWTCPVQTGFIGFGGVFSVLLKTSFHVQSDFSPNKQQYLAQQTRRLHGKQVRQKRQPRRSGSASDLANLTHQTSQVASGTPASWCLRLSVWPSGGRHQPHHSNENQAQGISRGVQTGQLVPNIFTSSSNSFGTFSTHHKPARFGSSGLENDAKA